jgi:hypothetical protein
MDFLYCFIWLNGMLGILDKKKEKSGEGLFRF